MNTLSQTEENYLKAIYKVCEHQEKAASTNNIANELSTSAASVTDMLNRLADKQLVHYEKYKGVRLTQTGDMVAKMLIRKHRLWEVFLVEQLQFSWDEVHEIAEQLEHIQSKELVNRLDNFLGNPKYDPHGDPIPDAAGQFTFRRKIVLADMQAGEEGTIIGVQEDNPTFLKYLDSIGIGLGTVVMVKEKFEFDGSVKILINQKEQQTLSQKVAQHLFVQ